MTRSSDSDLISAALLGSQDAADALFERYWPTAWWTALAVTGDRTLADDAAQAAIERAFGALDGFDRSRPFRPWLARIATNQALNLIRARGREVLVAEWPEEEPAGEPALGLEEREELYAALRALPKERRLVLALRYFAGLEPLEIAEALDLPVGTVASRHSRGLAALRRDLEVTRR